MKRRQVVACLATLPLAALQVRAASAATFVMPPTDIDLLGTTRTVTPGRGESLIDVARRYGLGQDAMRRANPTLPRWLPLSGRNVVLPTRHVLPAAAREGLVVNLPERRLYDYSVSLTRGQPPSRMPLRARIAVYPISIGRVEWATPLGDTRIVSRRADPDWTPPESIRIEAAARGRTLPAVVPAGPDNPLGRHALYLDLPGYLLHGTNDVDAIGLRVTHGCVRLYPGDIAALYRRVPDGTRVRFVDEPIKVGWHAGLLHLEVHPPLEERNWLEAALLDEALRLVARAVRRRVATHVDSTRVRRAVEQRQGLPVVVSRLF